MSQIKFSHNYPKLHGQKWADLVRVHTINRESLTDKFVDYDTTYDGGKYPLPPGNYMVLVFLGNEFIPFTTVRRYTEKKYHYYKSNIGKTFTIAVEKKS